MSESRAEGDVTQDPPPYWWRWLDDVPEGYEIGPRPPHSIRFAQSIARSDDIAVRGPELGWHSLSEAIKLDWLRPDGYCRRCDGTGTIEVDKPPKTVMRECLCGGGPGPWGERPCGQCGGTGALLDLEQQDPREMCPDCEGRGLAERAPSDELPTKQQRDIGPRDSP